MAAIENPPPGSTYGPCIWPCPHRDCAEMREDAEQKCELCQKPIGYETKFYRRGLDQYVSGPVIFKVAHQICVLDFYDQGGSEW